MRVPEREIQNNFISLVDGWKPTKSERDDPKETGKEIDCGQRRNRAVKRFNAGQVVTKIIS